MNMYVVAFLSLSLLQCLISESNAAAIGQTAAECEPSVCKLPDCFCSGTVVPKNLEPNSIPQMIMMSFDDAVNERVYSFYTSLFDGESKNPNGCNRAATFFVSHEWTDYQMMQTLYHNRHEIADHTISHRLPIPWWKNATAEEWGQEILGMREILRKFGNVNEEDVKGFRAPYLQIGGNNEFGVLHDNKFTFESSMPTQQFMDPPMWPYTLDYKTRQECVIPPCPTDSYPGLWEVPMVDYRDLDNKLCNMIDRCTAPANRQQTFELIYKNFKRHYQSNRAPFPMFMHADWFHQHPERLEGVKDFIKNVSRLDDVYFVTISQAIKWIQSPTTLDKIEDFKPWKCDSPAPPVCSRADVNVCHYADNGDLGQPGSPLVAHYLFTCTKPCPNHYPWVGNPDGN